MDGFIEFSLSVYYKNTKWRIYSLMIRIYYMYLQYVFFLDYLYQKENVFAKKLLFVAYFIKKQK